MMAQMPLPEKCGRVTTLAQHLGYEYFVVSDSTSRARTRSSEHVDTVRVASREQAGTRCSTHCLGDIPVGKIQTFVRHLVQMGCLEAPRAKLPYVCVALIISHDNDDIGSLIGEFVLLGKHRERYKADNESQNK